MVVEMSDITKPELKPLNPKPSSGPRLTFSDGLNFGCGFWVAGFLFFVVAVPVVSIGIALFLRNIN
jgi:hypothetical protein